MSSQAVHYRHLRGDRINNEGSFAMVSCARCVQKSLPCKLSSLSKKCGNCEYVGAKECVPQEIPIPDFSKLDRQVKELERQEELEEAALATDETEAELVVLRMRARRNKLRRIRKQKLALRREEQRIFDAGLPMLDELEALESLNQDLEQTLVPAEPSSCVAGWHGDTVPEAGGSS